MFKKLILFSTIFISSLCSSTIHIDKKSVHVSVLEKSYMYIDESSSLSFEQIQKKKFEASTTNYVRFGYSPITLWTKFSIKNNSNEDITRYFTISNPMLDTIELYAKTDKGYDKKVQGVLHLDQYNRNNILHPSFEVPFKAGELKEFYYKTHTISCAHYFKLHVKDKITLYKDEFSYQLIETLFFGAMLALIIYNLFIYFFIRELAYLYYGLYMFFTIWNHSSYSIMLAYIITDDPAAIAVDAFMSMYYLTFMNIFAIMFIKTFLELKKYKFHNFLLNSVIFMNILLMISSSMDNYLLEYFTYIIFITLLLILYICIYSLYKKNPQAKYVVVGWSINAFGLGTLAFQQFGIPNPTDYFPYFYESTVFLEAILFSVALASKLNTTKELEKSVKTNIILTRELHHRVKNNMQFIILMYRLKLEKLTNSDIDQKLNEIEGSIQAMSKTHEILYTQDDLETIDTKEYFENLLDELKRSFNTKDIKISLHVEANLDIQSSIHCGIILNELITNSFKYAFKNGLGNINISLTKVDGNYVFTIEDDGVGFDYETKRNESFGLSFVETMVKDELKGTFTIETKKGTKIIITL